MRRQSHLLIDSCQLRVFGDHEVSPWHLPCSETQPGLIFASISFQTESYVSTGPVNNVCFPSLCKIVNQLRESSGGRGGYLGLPCSLSLGSGISWCLLRHADVPYEISTLGQFSAVKCLPWLPLLSLPHFYSMRQRPLLAYRMYWSLVPAPFSLPSIQHWEFSKSGLHLPLQYHVPMLPFMGDISRSLHWSFNWLPCLFFFVIIIWSMLN